MTNTAEQLAFPFASLDFSGRTTVGLGEIAAKLGCTLAHLLNECESGAICGINIAASTSARRAIRVPVEAYRLYVLQRMTGEFRRDFIRDLPAHVKRELRREMIGASDRAELVELMKEIKDALGARKS